MTLSAKNFEELMRSIRNRVEHPQADFNKRANIRPVFGPLNIAWRDRSTGEMLAEVYQYGGTVRVYLFDTQGRAVGSGPDARSAYRAAWRDYRLCRHDTAALLRELAQHRRLALAMGKSLENYSQGLTQMTQEKRALDEQLHRHVIAQQHRRARHAAAIRAHRAEMTRRLRACRRALLDALNQRNAVASRITRMQTMVTDARARSPELEHLLRDLATDNIEQIVAVLLEHAGRAAEYHRRATAAEARADELQRGQQTLVAAATAAGLRYTVTDGRMTFEREAGDAELEAHGA